MWIHKHPVHTSVHPCITVVQLHSAHTWLLTHVIYYTITYMCSYLYTAIVLAIATCMYTDSSHNVCFVHTCAHFILGLHPVYKVARDATGQIY